MRWLKATLFVLILSSCEHVDDATVNSVTQQLKETVDQVSALTPKVQSLTIDQLKNLYAIEYKVMDVSLDKDPMEVEALLMALGRERWSCQSNIALEKQRFVCSRRPVSYLEYLRYASAWMP